MLRQADSTKASTAATTGERKLRKEVTNLYLSLVEYQNSELAQEKHANTDMIITLIQLIQRDQFFTQKSSQKLSYFQHCRQTTARRR